MKCYIFFMKDKFIYIINIFYLKNEMKEDEIRWKKHSKFFYIVFIKIFYYIYYLLYNLWITFGSSLILLFNIILSKFRTIYILNIDY